jgi:hypothetical protein
MKSPQVSIVEEDMWPPKPVWVLCRNSDILGSIHDYKPHDAHNTIYINGNEEDLQQIQLTSTENYFSSLANLKEYLGSDDAIATSRMAADIDQVQEPSTKTNKLPGL